jgi:hypothetical protein
VIPGENDTLNFPTLSRSRLYKSICFAKSDRSYKSGNLEDEQMKQMAHKAKYVCLYIFGGAHIPEIANLLHAAFYRSTTKFSKFYNEDKFR